jgi:hypothetical protein
MFAEGLEPHPKAVITPVVVELLKPRRERFIDITKGKTRTSGINGFQWQRQSLQGGE